MRIRLHQIVHSITSRLHDGRAQRAFAAGDRGLDQGGVVDEDKELVAGAAVLGMQVSVQIAAARCGKDGARLSIQAMAFANEG